MINRLSDGNKKSLRKAGSSKKFQSEKNIIAIFARKSNDVKYHELIYISDVQGIYEKNEKLLEILGRAYSNEIFGNYYKACTYIKDGAKQ